MEVVSLGQVLNAFGDPMVCVGFRSSQDDDACGAWTLLDLKCCTEPQGIPRP
jgi:hypothetical protein